MNYELKTYELKRQVICSPNIQYTQVKCAHGNINNCSLEKNGRHSSYWYVAGGKSQQADIVRILYPKRRENNVSQFKSLFSCLCNCIPQLEKCCVLLLTITQCCFHSCIFHTPTLHSSHGPHTPYQSSALTHTNSMCLMHSSFQIALICCK